MEQLHKRFNSKQVKELIKRYVKKEVKRKYIEKILQISKTRFFEIVKKVKAEKKKCNIKNEKKSSNNRIDNKIERNIVNELEIDKTIIEDKQNPTKRYNYSFIKERLQEKHKQKVSINTIIDRAKKEGYYKARKAHKKHTREVLTNYTGELIQHDSSYHIFAPDSRKKWYLITSIDDYSRYMLYAKFIERETRIEHIKALEKVFLKYGYPMKYYVDSHAIFRVVQGRDGIWRKHILETDEANTQWKKIMDECEVEVSYALSPQAKGKIERPYQWVQDHIVRICVREGIKEIAEGQKILDREIKKYNFKRVHHTTEEVPYYRFKRALKKNNVWRRFEIPKPYEAVKDIFTLRVKRRANGYRRISLDKKEIQVNGLNPYEEVEIRIYQLNNNLLELRFWRKAKLLDVQKIKTIDLKTVRF